MHSTLQLTVVFTNVASVVQTTKKFGLHLRGGGNSPYEDVKRPRCRLTWSKLLRSLAYISTHTLSVPVRSGSRELGLTFTIITVETSSPMLYQPSQLTQIGLTLLLLTELDMLSSQFIRNRANISIVRSRTVATQILSVPIYK